LKTEMRMEMLRTRSPALVRKEVAAHLLAYNLDPGADGRGGAGRGDGAAPAELKGALHTVRSFEAGHLYDPGRIAADLPRLLALIGRKRAGDRPDRSSRVR
jgi:hypothetical protein